MKKILLLSALLLISKSAFADFAPSDLMITPISSSSMKLDWIDNSGGTAQYIIKRSFSPFMSFTKVAITAVGASSYLDGEGLELFPNTTYYYRIEMVMADPVLESNISYATTFPAP